MRMSRRATLHFPAGFDPTRDLTYTGSYSIVENADGNWEIDFLTSGTLTFLKDPKTTIDVWGVGGGGGGGRNNGASNYYRGGGGGGGYSFLASGLSVVVGTGYPIVVGTGGAGRSGSNGNGVSGTASSAFGNSGGGGIYGESNGDGGNGGSGGGATGAYGGGNGGDGYDNNDTGAGIYNWGGDGSVGAGSSQGQLSGTYMLKWRTSGQVQYGDGAPGYAPSKGSAPTGNHGANSGYGGKGGYTTGYEAEDGQDGRVSIRNHR